ncbi:3-carboxy-cis,cis-muconate cycloisomerase [Polaromonas sp. SM01]|uniref:3-carboxy-cis,cis-muconate cycloisomerase n=1 Tax=Polaromonas sp. SM01 TaxID=3085630 RepID=UPI0029821747|nr:3-carboxy-cis,cis-muconate cycloisomerase [Polaromonas sp. SM01]MDW5444508.1 3-carboxy-cis,cis-muconate cycloisomerase [Polaromonas sp. SM01]
MSIFDDFLSSPEALQAFASRDFVAAMLRFEEALAHAQAQAGLIPESASASIGAACDVSRHDVAGMVQASAVAGSVAIPLIKSLKAVVAQDTPEALPWVHFASTSQDVIDTAMALATRDVLALIQSDVRQLVQTLFLLAEQHAASPMLARTLMQPASVTSFGWKCCNWVAPLVRSLARLQRVQNLALCVQLGGAAGTQAGLQGKGAQVTQLMAERLGLHAPQAPWHTQRDEWVALACELGLLAGSLGKIAKDIALMGQFEVAELAEPSEPGRGGSSAMPHKRNPVACMATLAAAQRAPQHVAALLAAMPQEHERALGGWQAELAEWPQLLMSVQGAARAMAQMLPGLQVHTARMRTNIATLAAQLPAEAVKEWFDLPLAEEVALLVPPRLAQLRASLQISMETK